MTALGLLARAAAEPGGAAIASDVHGGPPRADTADAVLRLAAAIQAADLGASGLTVVRLLDDGITGADLAMFVGVNIYPAAAEQVLQRHPDVADVACIGLPDDVMGERLVALVQPVPGAHVAPDVLGAWCRTGLAGYKCPKEFRFVDELPRNSTGQMDKRSLRAAQA
jgi:acyl-CoA synthetase (AMP-forming)/AMP-acid ligase II